MKYCIIIKIFKKYKKLYYDPTTKGNDYKTKHQLRNY